MTYYVTTSNGYRLVATMNNLDGDPATVFRFTAMLKDGQEVVMSMPRPIGQEKATRSHSGAKVIALRWMSLQEELVTAH